MPSTLPRRSQYGQARFSRDWQGRWQSIMRRCASCAAPCETSRDIMRNITHSFACRIEPQHRACEKLTGEIVKHDAKLAHQNSQKLHFSRDIDVFTICFSPGGGGVRVYVTPSYASGPPVVKLDPILFGVSCREDMFLLFVCGMALLGMQKWAATFLSRAA